MSNAFYKIPLDNIINRIIEVMDRTDFKNWSLKPSKECDQWIVLSYGDHISMNVLEKDNKFILVVGTIHVNEKKVPDSGRYDKLDKAINKICYQIVNNKRMEKEKKIMDALCNASNYLDELKNELT